MKKNNLFRIIFIFALLGVTGLGTPLWTMYYTVRPDGTLEPHSSLIGSETPPDQPVEEEEEDVDTTEENLNAAANDAAKALDDEKSKNAAVPSGGNTSASVAAIDGELEGGEAAVTEAENDEVVMTGENAAASDEETKIKEAPSGGDPVKLSTGSYEQSETDIQGQVSPAITVQRYYSSRNTVTGSMGYGWVTNLDERIILGTQPGYKERQAAIQNYVDMTANAITKLENTIIQIYQVSSVENAVTELEKRIEVCNLNLKTSQELYDWLYNLSISAQGYSVRDRIDSLKYDAYIHVNAIIEKINLIKDNKIRLESDLAKLPLYMAKHISAVAQLNDYKKIVEKTNARKEKNRLAMFTGMELSVEETGLDTLTVIDSQGYPHLLKETSEASGIWKREGETLIKECRSTGSGYVVMQVDGTVKQYDGNGFLIQTVDRNGNWIRYERGPGERLNTLSNSFGESYTVSYTGSLINAIVNNRSAEEKVIYTFNGNKLSAVKDTDGDTVTMKYNQAGYMTHLYKCDGSFVEFVYGLVTQDGRALVTATKNEEGFEEKFDYDIPHKTTTYTDHDGNKTVYVYDDNYRTKDEYRADGTAIHNRYDGQGNLVQVTQNQNDTYYAYDDRGNKIRASYSDGTYELWSYDSYNQLLEYTDSDGVTTEYERDSKGNLISCKVGKKSVFSQGIDSRGLLEWRTVHGQNAVTTTYKYDTHGNLEYQICAGVKTEYEYDQRNRVTKIICDNVVTNEYEYKDHKIINCDYKGLKTTYVTNGRKDMTQIILEDVITGVVHKTRIEYDRRHLPLNIFEGDGQTEALVSSYLYTPEGKVKTQISHGQSESWVITYSYENGEVHEVKQFKTNASSVVPEQYVGVPEHVEGPLYIQTYTHSIHPGNKKLLTVTDGMNNQTLFEYDFNGNLVKTTDANGTERSMIYSDAGRLKGEQSSHGGWYMYEYNNGNLVLAGEKNGEAVQSSYYPDGSLKSTTDRYGKTNWYNYDTCGRISSIQSEVQTIWYEYDSFDRVIRQTVGDTPDEYGAVYYITYDYSSDGRTLTVIEGGKYKTVSQLDAFGNVISLTDGNGNTKRYEYDCQNRLVKTYDGYENATTYEYNALGKISRVILPDGAQTEYHYNCMGLVEQVSDECGVVYAAEYDRSGRLISERNRADSKKVYEYDKGGRVTKALCGGEVVEAYDYGQDNRTVTVTDGNGEDYIYNYNAFGRLTDEHNRNGLIQSYTYDADGQSNGQTNFDGTTTSIIYSSDRTERTVRYSDGSQNRFVYDAMGNIVEASNAYGTTLYSYDPGGRLICQKDVTTGEEVHFEYDTAGNRTRLYSSNRETVYSYGKNNEVKEIFDNKQRVRVQLEYNINGLEVLRKFANGTREETLYDRAGRVIVKVQKSERGELLWGEGYTYGSDGKRTATVDNTGRVTLYEYNNKGELATVYYPYTQEHLQKLCEEAEINGLSVNADPGQNKFLSSDIHTQMVRLLNSMQYGISGALTNLQIFIKESYTYDGNGNRISKTTDYGTINYSYDKENCLVSSGSRGQTYVTYTYDNAGNLLSEQSALKSVEYAYNAQNRLTWCQVIDTSAREYSQTAYAYDALGRRVLVQDVDQSALRTIYDGFSFDVIKTSPTYASGMFTDSSETGIRWGNAGKPTGDRYRYLSDQDMSDGNRYFYLDEGNYHTNSSRYYGERTQISANGTIAAQVSDEGNQYFTTDLFGSVTIVSDSTGYQLDGYTYDAFGTLVQGELSGTTDFGYLGKQHDPASNLYNYGYRDYNPQQARFTTVDPIRDGTNWFSYVNNDPVNFVDLWGLFYYTGDNQRSSNTYKQTEVYVYRHDDGTGNEFNSTRMVYKNGVCVYVDQVGANCSEQYYDGEKNFTEPDGIYYYSAEGLKANGDGTYDSDSYHNVLRHKTDDPNIPENVRNAINNTPGDFLEHGNQRIIDKDGPYNNNQTPGGAGCTIGMGGQAHQDEYMAVLMDGVDNPEKIKRVVTSYVHVEAK